jgi:cobalt/nickel transport system permease protein
MHIPDGVLDPAVMVAAGAASAGALAWAGATMRRSASPPKVALAVAAGGGVMIAHLFDVTLVGGQTAHLLGGMLLAVVLGPRLGLVTMAAVLALEAVLLGDGGVAALGVNVLVMGVAGVLGGWAVYRWVASAVPMPLAAAAGAAVGALASVAASTSALWLVGAGTPSVHFLAWGALEAALTAALVAVAVGVGAAVGPDGTLAARRRLRVGPLPDSGAHAA